MRHEASSEIIERQPRRIAKKFPIRPFFEKTTVQDSYRWPSPDKNGTVTFVNLNTQRSQVDCLMVPDKFKDNKLTTYEDNYIKPEKFPPLIPKRVPTISFKKPTDFRLETKTTTYKEMNLPLMSAIRRNMVVYVTPVRPPNALQVPYNFKNSSEYKSSFSKKEIKMERALARAPTPEKVLFRGESTMRSDYTYKKCFPRIPSPKEKGVLSPETRDFCTTYRFTYKKKAASGVLFYSFLC
ncbi:hypothetical protein LSM04_001375 [Trypanosoma melophagium]|uniref:uncharacterized protein n=1 Tax=Trypanosoma melophagium TaxID=715481 RepID=UPI00351A8F56|nr:hypothetical protein LSM04_001375 [Trypanosoma melophagium]